MRARRSTRTPSTSATAPKKVTIEGHTDERGGREYNLALGQKRAEAVAKSLTPARRRPTRRSSRSASARSVRRSRAATEAAWAKNRRAELVSR
jgi:peptidoglycan-associated lipoprotein